jgi:hypothetical protein
MRWSVGSGISSASTRGRRCRRLVGAAAVGLAATMTAAVAYAGNNPAPDEAAAEGGIWKAVVPAPGVMHGEFENDDPIGLTAGVRIRADCSINWVDPDTGKLYCFASATSLVWFLDAPHTYLERARAQWSYLGDSAR